MFFISLVFYFLLLFNLNNKTLVLMFFILIFVFYLFNKSFKKSLLFAYLASWPINVGKTYVFEFVHSWQLNLSFRPYGIADTIVISIREVLMVLMLAILVREFFMGKRRVFKFDRLSLLLAGYFLSLVLSSVLGSIRPDISLILSFYSVSPLILYWYVRNLIEENKNLFFPSLAIFLSIIILEFVFAGTQFILRNPIGLSIEESQNFLPMDQSLEAEILGFRPVGTFSHANGLANFLLIFLFIFLPSMFGIMKITPYAFLFALGGILLTLSRSAWLSFVFFLIIFLFVIEKKWRVRLKISKGIKRLFFLSFPVTLPFLIFLLIPRLVNSFYAFDIYGGGYTRVELIKEAVETIIQYPLFGVGLGMEILHYYQNSLGGYGGIASYFPEAVHNGYLSLFVQAGIFPLIFFLLISIVVFRGLIKSLRTEKEVFRRILTLSLICGLGSIYLNGFIQPFLPDLQKVIFLSMIYGGQLKHLRVQN